MAFTYFFRDLQTLELIAKHVIPDLKRRRYINTWDAGCAMGPEPYSLAIMFRENMGNFLFRNVRVYATDIDESGQFGEIIDRGAYPEAQLKRIPSDILSKYFLPDAEEGFLRISDEIKRAIDFQQHDILSLQPIREELGLIVCKNVLLHFSPQDRVAAIRMFHSALSQGGYLATEQTQILPADTAHLFERVTNAGQLFRKV